MGRYEDYKDIYINAFASYMSDLTDEEFTTDEAKKLFKDFMYYAKNIKVDFRFKFWQETFKKGMEKAGYRFNYFGGEL